MCAYVKVFLRLPLADIVDMAKRIVYNVNELWKGAAVNEEC